MPLEFVSLDDVLFVQFIEPHVQLVITVVFVRVQLVVVLLVMLDLV